MLRILLDIKKKKKTEKWEIHWREHQKMFFFFGPETKVEKRARGRYPSFYYLDGKGVSHSDHIWIWEQINREEIRQEDLEELQRIKKMSDS